MVNLTSFFQVSGISGTFDVDVLHWRPQRALWGHENFIRLIGVDLVEKCSAVCAECKIPAFIQTKTFNMSTKL